MIMKSVKPVFGFLLCKLKETTKAYIIWGIADDMPHQEMAFPLYSQTVGVAITQLIKKHLEPPTIRSTGFARHTPCAPVRFVRYESHKMILKQKKKCTKCKKWKAPAGFSKHPTTKDGRAPHCKICHNTVYRKKIPNAKPKRVYTAAHEHQVCSMRLNNVTYREIVRQTGIPQSRVLNILRKNKMVNAEKSARTRDMKYRGGSKTVDGKKACCDCGGDLGGNWKYCPKCIGQRRRGIIPYAEVTEMLGTQPITSELETLFSKYIPFCGEEKRSIGK